MHVSIMKYMNLSWHTSAYVHVTSSFIKVLYWLIFWNQSKPSACLAKEENSHENSKASCVVQHLPVI